MIADSVRLTEVVMVQKGAELDFWYEGVYIGSIVEGTVMNRKPKVEQPEVKRPRAGITKSLTPDQVKISEAKKNEKVISAEQVAEKAANKSLIEWQKK